MNEEAKTLIAEKIVFLEGHKENYLDEVNSLRKKVAHLEGYVSGINESIKSLQESLKALDG